MLTTPEETVTAIVYLCDPGTSVLWQEAADVIRRRDAAVRAAARRELYRELASQWDAGADAFRIMNDANGVEFCESTANEYRRRAEEETP